MDNNNMDLSIDWVRELLESSSHGNPSLETLPSELSNQQLEAEILARLSEDAGTQMTSLPSPSSLETLFAPHTDSRTSHVRNEDNCPTEADTLEASLFEALLMGSVGNPMVELPPDPGPQASLGAPAAPSLAPFRCPDGTPGEMDVLQPINSRQSPGTSMMPLADATVQSYTATWPSSAGRSSGSAVGIGSHATQIQRAWSDGSAPAMSLEESKKMLPSLFAKIFVDMLDSPASSASVQQSMASCSSMPQQSPLSPSQPLANPTAGQVIFFPPPTTSPEPSGPRSQRGQHRNLASLSESSAQSSWSQSNEMIQQRRRLIHQAHVGRSRHEGHVPAPGLSRQASLPMSAPNAPMGLNRLDEAKRQALLHKLGRHLTAGRSTFHPLPYQQQQTQQQQQEVLQQQLKVQLQQRLQQAGTEELLQRALQLEQLQHVLKSHGVPVQQRQPAQVQGRVTKVRDQREELSGMLAKFLSSSGHLAPSPAAQSQQPNISRPTVAVSTLGENLGHSSAVGPQGPLSQGSPSVLPEGFHDDSFPGDKAMPRGTRRPRVGSPDERETSGPDPLGGEGHGDLEEQEGEEGVEGGGSQACGPGKRKRILRERQRRTNMRDQVNRLHSLLPKSVSQSIAQDTLSTIAAAADFIEELKKKCDME